MKCNYAKDSPAFSATCGRFAVIVCLLVAAMSIGCSGGGGDNAGRSQETRSYRVGIAPIPKNFPGSSEDDWLDMFSKIQEVGEIVVVQNEWRDSVGTSGQIPEFLQLIGQMKDSYGYRPQFGINFFKGEGEPYLAVSANATNDWTNEDAIEQYKQVALAICRDYGAEYLALGVEVNTYYQYHREDFDRFVDVYKMLYDQIKTQYPDTKIFVTFQLEKMKGIGDETFGVEIDPQWDILGKFEDKLDLVAFTTYPEVEYISPDEMPEDYYSEIAERIDKPLAFTEIGWSSASGFTGEPVPGSYTKELQSDFILRFVELTAGMNIEFVNWIFMHDLDTAGPQTKVGLRTTIGEAKKSWETWKELRDTDYEGSK